MECVIEVSLGHILLTIVFIEKPVKKLHYEEKKSLF